MSTLSTHVLDTARGRPASGMEVVLEARVADAGGDQSGPSPSRATSGSEAIPLHPHQLTGQAGAGAAPIQLHPHADNQWRPMSTGVTNDDGRIPELLPDGMELSPGTYRLTFRTGDWQGAQGITGFYPTVTVEFVIAEATEHYHVPLLISPYGYSTYRGS